jgi:hypothetical protein
MEVARLDAMAAENEKKANILRGEGEAARKKLIMNADGALEKKLEALVTINEKYAEAIKGYSGNWVPSIVMGAANGAANGAMELVNLLTAKTARELAVDLSVKKQSQ